MLMGAAWPRRTFGGMPLGLHDHLLAVIHEAPRLGDLHQGLVIAQF